MTDAWVLRLKDDAKEEGMVGDYYYQDEEYAEFLTQDLTESTIFYDKEAAVASMKFHEDYMFKKFGDQAFINAGYTNMMKNFEWVEVEVESPESTKEE